MAGPKNHMVVMPDADKVHVVSSLVGASCGVAGQRCMAILVAVLVGDATRDWVGNIKNAITEIRAGAPGDDGAAYGPLINRKSRDRVCELIQGVAAEGADVLLNGSDCEIDGYPDGNWLGPTVFDNVTSEMEIDQEEIFGPALCVMIAACSLGIVQAALDASWRYLDKHGQFGRPLAAFQALQFKLADRVTELIAARQMVWLAASRLDRSHPEATADCAMAKRLATDLCFEICNQALQIHDGYGYIREYPLERHMRDVRVHPILERRQRDHASDHRTSCIGRCGWRCTQIIEWAQQSGDQW